MGKTDLKLIIPPKRYAQIEETVVKLHIDLELSIPVNPRDVAKRLGYVIKMLSEYIENDGDQELRNGVFGKKQDGLSYYDFRIQKYVIWVNDIDSYSVKHDEFTIMHEIGHIMLGHKVDSQLAEMEANCYASYCLVPSPLPCMFSCGSPADIAATFNVSDECAMLCFKRFINWYTYPRDMKQYEEKLITYYKGVLERGKSL